MAIGYGLDGRGSIPGRGTRFFSTSQRPHLLMVPGARPVRENDHSTSSSAEVKNDEAIPSLSHTFNGLVHN
jgi:hypothetical protein